MCENRSLSLKNTLTCANYELTGTCKLQTIKVKNIDRKSKLLLKGPVSEITKRCFLLAKGLLLLKYTKNFNCRNHTQPPPFISSSSGKLVAPHKAWHMYYIFV